MDEKQNKITNQEPKEESKVENVTTTEKRSETKQEENASSKQETTQEKNTTNKEATQKEETKESEIKQEASETIKQTKEQMKNINFKEEAQKGKGLISKLFLDPIQTIKEIVKDETNQFYKTAVLLIVLWVAIIFLKEILRAITYEFYTFKLLATLKLMISPVLKVLVMAIIIHGLNKDNKQSLMKAITTVTIAKIPVIISACLGFLTFISSRITYITSPISSLLSVISTVLMFFVVKEMFNEKDNSKALKSFVKVEVVYYVVVFVFNFLGISI